ncbi:MAG: hypothetical protein U0176_15425 [Bacteroidia bacterium]
MPAPVDGRQVPIESDAVAEEIDFKADEPVPTTTASPIVPEQTEQAESLPAKRTFIDRHRQRIAIGLGLAAFLAAMGFIGWASSRKDRSRKNGLREERYQHEAPKSKILHSFQSQRRLEMKDRWKGILVASGFAVALVGGTLLGMLVYGIGFPMFGLALLAALCTIAAMAVFFLIGLVILRIVGPDPRPGGGRFHNLGAGCFYAIMTLLVVMPLAVIIGALTMGIFLPAIVGVAAHFGTSILAALCLAAPMVGALALGYELILNN